jgi:predicted MFS family arabinose efflux permease
MEKLWNPNYCKVMAANFSLFFAFYLLTPLLPLYLSENFGATKDMIGLVLSGYTVTALLSRPFSGFMVDSFDRKHMLMFFYALFFAFFAGYLVAGSILLFAIVRTLHGAPFGSLTVANSTVAIDVLPSSRRNEGIGFYGLSNNLAMALAPTTGIAIYQLTGNFHLLFWLSLIVAGAGLAIDSTVKLQRRPLVSKTQKWSFDRFFLTRGWLLAANMVFFGFCFGVLQNYLAIYSKEALGITGGTGVFFMIVSVGLIVSRLMGSRSLRNGKLTENALHGMLFSTTGYVLFVACANHFGYYLSALLIGLGNGLIWPAFLNMIIAMAYNNQRGTANSTLLVSWDVGIGLGVLIGGFLVEFTGYTATFLWVAMAQVGGAALFVLATKGFFMRRRLAAD